MKCDDFLRHATTGAWPARWRARLHAARCRRCAAVRDSLLRIQTELGRAEPLTAAQKRLWTSVAGSVDRRAAARFGPLPRLALAGGLATLLALAGWLGLQAIKARLPQNPPGLVPSDNAVAMTFWTNKQLGEIEGQMKSLSDDLDRLAARTSLLDAQREVRELVAAYPPLVIRN